MMLPIKMMLPIETPLTEDVGTKSVSARAYWLNAGLAPLLGAGLLALSLTACPAKPGPVQLDGGSDAGTVDAGPPARTLVDYHLFGDMPLDNGVLDPQMSAKGFGWFAFSGSQNSLNVVRRSQPSPTGQPILMLPKNDAQAGQAFVGGLARGGQGPHLVSFWVGRPAGTMDFDSLQLSVAGHDPAAGRDFAVDLAVDPEPGTMYELDGVLWQHRLAMIDRDLFGWAMLVVADPSPAPLYLSGPLLAPASLSQGLLHRFPSPIIREQLRLGELRAFALLKQRLRAKLTSPDPAVERVRAIRAQAKAIFEAIGGVPPLGQTLPNPTHP